MFRNRMKSVGGLALLTLLAVVAMAPAAQALPWCGQWCVDDPDARCKCLYDPWVAYVQCHDFLGGYCYVPESAMTDGSLLRAEIFAPVAAPAL
jgi:hypothetical protein